MQLNNFYSDPVPSVRNPLDSIVLSPHTIGTHEVSLAQMEAATSGYRSVLPSIHSCDYHYQDTCRETNSFLRYIGKWCRQLNRRCGH